MEQLETEANAQHRWADPAGAPHATEPANALAHDDLDDPAATDVDWRWLDAMLKSASRGWG